MRLLTRRISLVMVYLGVVGCGTTARDRATVEARPPNSAERPFIDLEKTSIDVSLEARVVRLVRERLEVDHGVTTWTGRIADDPGSVAVFSKSDSYLAGNIITSFGKLYEFRPTDAAPVEIPTSGLPDELDTAVNPLLLQEVGRAPERCDDTLPIDVLFVYTPAARMNAGGVGAIRSLIGRAVALTNKAFAQSQVHIAVRAVHMAEVHYTESGYLLQDRDRMLAPADTFMDTVPPLRDQYGADVVLLIVASGDTCGAGYEISQVSVSNAPIAYAAVRLNCVIGNYSVAHEIGHVLSGRHDWVTDPTDNSPFHGNHGYFERTPSLTTVNPWCTIMSYRAPCSTSTITCNKILYWSNPALQFPAGSTSSDPLGMAAEPHPADNHSALNASWKTVVRYRCRKVPLTLP